VGSELPVLGRRPERADARANRERILRAAAQLVASRGLAAVTMEEIAEHAGVAKGTLFHRFGSRAGLAVALVDESERQLQESVLSGPPPLGPGAEPAARLAAFLEALLDLTQANLELLLVSDYDSPGGRYRSGAYAAWRLHVSLLLGEMGLAERAEGLAHALLAPLAADLLEHRLVDERATIAEMRGELRLLVESLRDASAG
jgi:AcrR family transcriptional regulator